VPPGLASVNAQYEARARALVGEELRTLHLLDHARDLIELRRRSGDDRIYWAQHHDETFLNANEAHCRVDLGQAVQAVTILEGLVPDGDPQPRQAGPLALLALAHARGGDPQAAASAGGRALDVPLSANTSAVLDTVGGELGRWDDEVHVQDFRRRLAEQRATRQDPTLR
jgi:hypothetical protein